jgi:GTP-binding protein
LLDRIYEFFPPETEGKTDEDRISVAVIGKPNAGKSSLINTVLGETRVIVSDVPGTTRDSVDTFFENEYGRFTFIDTAGIRRKAKVEEAIERYSVLRALMAIDRADVCVVMLDATEGVSEQDAKIAGYAHEKGKPTVLAVNKWDAVEKETKNHGGDARKGGRSFLVYVLRADCIYLCEERREAEYAV